LFFPSLKTPLFELIFSTNQKKGQPTVRKYSKIERPKRDKPSGFHPKGILSIV